MNQGKLHYGWIVIFMGMLTGLAHSFYGIEGWRNARIAVHRWFPESDRKIRSALKLLLAPSSTYPRLAAFSSARLNERQHRLCKVARSFLGQIVTNPRNHSALISARKESIVVHRAT